MFRNSAIRNAAAPRVGGDSNAPMPAADRMAPPTAGRYPALRRSGHDTDPSITVVATPLPDTVPSRKPASVTVRPGAAPERDFPMTASAQLMKKVPAPDCSSTAP